jgi:hypothetical protein
LHAGLAYETKKEVEGQSTIWKQEQRYHRHPAVGDTFLVDGINYLDDTKWENCLKKYIHDQKTANNLLKGEFRSEKDRFHIFNTICACLKAAKKDRSNGVPMEILKRLFKEKLPVKYHRAFKTISKNPDMFCKRCTYVTDKNCCEDTWARFLAGEASIWTGDRDLGFFCSCGC